MRDDMPTDWGPSADPQAAGLAVVERYSTQAVQDLLEQPLLPLLQEASRIHNAHHDATDVQRATLLSIKTGACPENCGYCPQSAHHKGVQLDRMPLMEVDSVLEAAETARQNGATRFCMGAAWRRVRDGKQFDRVLAMVRGVRAKGMECCVTLGMLDKHQAEALAEAGLTAYNHNIDTSPEFYPEIITTRTFQDRLETLAHVRDAGIQVCCGGIIGMGETNTDRAKMLAVLANMEPQPESVPINALVPVPGTPLGDRPEIDPMELVRVIAAARITMPKARVRLSAGRRRLSKEAQALCFMAGANSVFYGEQLLTTANADPDDDVAFMNELGVDLADGVAQAPAAAGEAAGGCGDGCGCV